MQVVPFWLAVSPSVLTSLIKPILFLCQCEGFQTIIYLDDILGFASFHAGSQIGIILLCSLIVLECTLRFPSMNFI